VEDKNGLLGNGDCSGDREDGTEESRLCRQHDERLCEAGYGNAWTCARAERLRLPEWALALEAQLAARTSEFV
jgi:hypothetical protein